ncbi:hypothetical protein WEI85_20295 [Actinomycetes bacterium KLBMP 9797]
MRLRTLASAAFAASVGALGLVALAPPAQAAAEQPRHCVLRLATANAPVTCYRTADEAAKDISGRGTGSPDRLRAAEVIVAVLYSDDDYEGSRLNLIAPWGCLTSQTSDVEWWYNLHEVAGGWWNDEVESFRTYSGCRATFYQHINLQGAQYGPRESFGDLEALNNEASSVAVT